MEEAYLVSGASDWESEDMGSVSGSANDSETVGKSLNCSKPQLPICKMGMVI